ncbi:MAG: twin-arginine translocase subunit TatC [Actinomycetota bacterium]|nr:twin-arginine translocase subunit TatC [Actinomycetota bacterium]
MAEPEGVADGQMTLVEHLSELRRRIFICVIAVAVCAVVMFILFPQILEILSEPYREVTKGVDRCGPEGCDLIATNPLAPFMVRLKVATYGGMALALPVIMWEVWRFIVPGLNPNERKYAIPFIVVTVLLFALGVFFAWLTLDKALQFLLIGSVGGEIEPFVAADEYLTLITLMMLAFGVAFELPVLLVFLMLVGVVTSQTLRKHRRWALIGIFAFSAIITPSQDPFSLLFMAVPMYVFYETAIVIGRVMKR